jgi:thiol-disulfide isomerase/thioredoxin
MMDLSCEWAVVDVVSTLGTDQNVTAQINKWPLDADGVRQRSSRAKKTPEEISLKDETVKQTIEELHANGEDAISLDAQTLKFAQDENDYLFVDFYASWCNHCRDLAPTWEALAELMLDASHKLGNQHPDDITPEDYQAAEKVLPVMVAKIDCVDHHDLCIQQEIRAYPTLRLFVDGEKYKDGDYRGHRNLLNMVRFCVCGYLKSHHRNES